MRVPFPSVFLSYASQDRALARALAKRLGEKTQIWFDEAELRPGQELHDVLPRAVAEADVFLLLLTRAAAESHWVNFELDQALGDIGALGRAKILPLRVGEAKLPELDRFFALSFDRRSPERTARLLLGSADEAPEFEHDVEELLRRAEVGYRKGVGLADAGPHPDYVVETAEGLTVGLEINATVNPGALKAVAARTRATWFQERLRLDAAFAVFPTIQPEQRPDRVVGVEQLLRIVGPEASEGLRSWSQSSDLAEWRALRIGRAFTRRLADTHPHPLSDDDHISLGERGAELVRAATAWRAHLGRMMSLDEVAEHIGQAPSAVAEFAANRRILALTDVEGGQQFPAFQFREEGSPYPELPELLAALTPHAASDFTVASWFVSRQSYLDDTPAGWLRKRHDPTKVLVAAKRDAARLAR